jgi:hypothetical protein
MQIGCPTSIESALMSALTSSKALTVVPNRCASTHDIIMLVKPQQFVNVALKRGTNVFHA